MTAKIDRGASVLNAADETVNPYGLILSEKEREIIYGELTCLENMTNALLCGKTGRKQQAKATLSALAEFGGLAIAAIILHRLSNISMISTLAIGTSFLVLQKLNLLLTHEPTDDTHARRIREDEKETKERAQYFRDMGCRDMAALSKD